MKDQKSLEESAKQNLKQMHSLWEDNMKKVNEKHEQLRDKTKKECL